jgi:hypothetical protein
LRKEIYPRTVRYYACGEYGGRTGRPHYHAIVYGLSACGACMSCSSYARRVGKHPIADTDCGAIYRSWPFGHIHIGDVTPGSCKYVADYLQKNSGELDFGGRQKAFSLMSKGLGQRWMLDHKDELLRDLNLIGFKGRVGLPRYYAKKLALLYTDSMYDIRCLMKSYAFRKAKFRDKEEYEWLIRNGPNGKDVGGIWRDMLKQRNCNVAAKKRLKESKL